MKRRIPQLTLAFLAVMAPGIAAAAPGDHVTIHGRVLDPHGRFLTLTGDNGRTYHVDLAGLDRSSFRDVKVGDFVSVSGVEGTYPNELQARTVVHNDARQPASSADTFVFWDWRIPRSHRYETYANGTYSPVDVTTIPTRVDAGEWIYDRTANAWLSHPSVGRNPAYLAGAAGQARTDPDLVMIDGWRLSRSHRYEHYQSDGSYAPVDVASVPSRIEQGEWIYDRTASAWLAHPSVGRNPQYFMGQRLTGRVQELRGNQLTLRTDDGRIVAVDLTEIRQASRPSLRWGDTVTISGTDTAGKFQANVLELVSPPALPRQ
jgi:hypothetical protein